jgi:hypothetical protein
MLIEPISSAKQSNILSANEYINTFGKKEKNKFKLFN